MFGLWAESRAPLADAAHINTAKPQKNGQQFSVPARLE